MTTRQLKATNYFSHDSNARNDEKIVRLRMKHNAAGYGVYFMVLERLREETNYMSAKDYNMIAFDLRVDAALVKSVIEDFGLFDFTEDGKFFYSESFRRRMGRKDILRRQRSEAGKAGMKTRWSGNKSKQNKKAKEKKETTPTPKNEPPAKTEEQKPISVSSPTNDNDKYLERFFRKDNQSNIEILLMSLGMKPDELPVLRSLANEVVNEWKMSEKQHSDYTDWSQHLISTMRIKRRDPTPSKGKHTNEQGQPPTSTDYQYQGGFGGKDI